MRRACFGLVLLTACLAAPAGAGEAIPWTRDTTSAFAQAGEHRGPVMILFTGPNCGPKAVPGEIARGGAQTKDLRDKCDLMEADVLSRPEVAAAAGRFVPLLVEQNLIANTDERSLERQYKVYTIPTVLFADPWGNEIIRLVGLVPRDKFLGVMKAMPSDFSPIEKAGPLLREDAENASALLAAAAFYRQQGLLPVAESLYDKALGTKELRGDAAARREATIARGAVLLQLDKAGDAAKLFEKALAEAPDGPMSDALLFGWMMAELHRSRIKEARKVYGELEKRFPGSAYTARAKQNLEGVAATKP